VQSGGPDINPFMKATLKDFDYYLAELGFNVVLGKGFKMLRLRFFVDIMGNGFATPDVVSYDAFPDDQVKRVTIVGGEVSLSLDPLMKLISAPVGTIVSNVLKISLDPWKFNLGYDKIDIQYSGDLAYNLLWDIRHNNIFRGFNPVIVLKKRKTLTNVNTKVRAIYEIQAHRENPLHLRPHVSLESNEKEIPILSA
jgi:hypothetical protein